MAFADVIARDPAKAVTPIFLMLFIIFLLLSSYECWFLTYELNISLFFNKIAIFLHLCDIFITLYD